MGPRGIDRKGSSQEGTLPLGIGATQIDHLPPRVGLQIQRPVGWEWTPCRAVLRPLRQTAAIGGEKLLRSALDHGQVGMVKARPDLGLPETVEVLDHGLKALLPWGHKDRRDPQAQHTRTTRPSTSGGL